MRTIKALLIITLTTTMLTAVAQDSLQRNKNTVFFEAGGNGFFYSVNYDRIMTDNQNWNLTGRAGLMYVNYFNSNARQMIGIPIEFSYIRGTHNNYFEFGLGITPIYDTYNPSQFSTAKDLVVLSVLRIGYRHQKPEGGIFFKAGLTPLRGVIFDLNSNPNSTEHSQSNNLESFVYPFAGVALGWTFKKTQ
jgi:hypothetical protein